MFRVGTEFLFYFCKHNIFIWINFTLLVRRMMRVKSSWMPYWLGKYLMKELSQTHAGISRLFTKFSYLARFSLKLRGWMVGEFPKRFPWTWKLLGEYWNLSNFVFFLCFYFPRALDIWMGLRCGTWAKVLQVRSDYVWPCHVYCKRGLGQSRLCHRGQLGRGICDR